MKKVITYGTYDLFHYGHYQLLKRAKALGDYLIVGLSTDEFNSIKDKKSIQPYKYRKAILEAIEFVDEVIPEKKWEQKPGDIEEHDIDIFVMGSDWENKFDNLKKYCEVVYLPRTEGISTSYIKKRIKNIMDNE